MDLPTRPDGPSPEDLLARADSLRDGKAWADAAELYADYLRCRPEHWQIWVQYGHCTKECGDAETALLLYREAERLRPEEADIHLHLGHGLKLLGRGDEAAEAYARALSLDPANEAARGELLALAGAAQPTSGAPGPAVAREAASACVFDASDLLDYAKRNRAPTGIQRVQLNLIERSLGLGGAVAAFDTASGAWKPVPRAAFERLAALSRSGADPDDPDWKDAVSALSDAVRRGPQLEFAPGGMLVTLGTAWWIPNYLLRVREAKARHGLRYVPMVYDCIPVVRPEDCAEGLCAEFAAWFAGACVHADAMLAISDCTRDDVLRLRRQLLPGADDLPVAVLPLHAGPLLPESAAAPPPPRRRPYVLFVATVEGRKNHLLVFNAWLTLIRRHGADAVPDLVCVGKRGWKADEAFALLAGSRTLRGRVFLLHDVSDAELDALYRGCLCTVFNSRYEGWGLPVTESIGYGKVPIVADNSSLRQAGGEAALFFASGSEPELVARLEAMLFDADFRAAQEAKVREAPPLRRWDELATDLAAALAAVPAVPTPPLARLAPFFRAGADYAVRALPGSDPTLEMAIADAVREGPCWGRLKEWGVRALRGCAVLRLPGGALHGTARVTLQMQGPPGGGRFGLRAGPAGAVDGPFRWIEATDHERLFCVLEVPDAAGRELVVEIDTPEGSRLEDGRLVGPNLLGFMVCAADDFAARLGYLERKALAKLIAV